MAGSWDELGCGASPVPIVAYLLRPSGLPDYLLQLSPKTGPYVERDDVDKDSNVSKNEAPFEIKILLTPIPRGFRPRGFSFEWSKKIPAAQAAGNMR
jgi:hypothetical protein